MEDKLARFMEQMQLSMQSLAQAVGASQKPPAFGPDHKPSTPAPLVTASVEQKEDLSVLQLGKLKQPSRHPKRTVAPLGAGIVSALGEELQGKRLPLSTSTSTDKDSGGEESGSDSSDSSLPEIDANTIRQTKAMAQDLRKQGGPRRWFRASEWFNLRNEKEAESICEALALLRKQGAGEEWRAVGHLQRRLQGLQAADALLK
jgi:hypothetical protein